MRWKQVLLPLLMYTMLCRADEPRFYTFTLNVHNITDERGNGYVPDDDVKQQVAILNKAYASSRIGFKLGHVDHSVNDCWSNLTSLNSDEEDEMVRNHQARKENDPHKVINVYVVNTLHDLDSMGRIQYVYDGYSAFPSDRATDLDIDHITVSAESFPNQGSDGTTLVHELGHHFGLYHPWEGGCDDPVGDEVADTPAQAFPVGVYASDKIDTCPKRAGRDALDNFMQWRTGHRRKFTPGQIKRMRMMIDTWRSSQY